MSGFAELLSIAMQEDGRVANARFTSSFSAVLWDPPATAGVLMYEMTLMNMNTCQEIVTETTSNPYCPMPAVQPCQYYTANVTAFSSEHHSDCVVTGHRGEYFSTSRYYELVNTNP